MALFAACALAQDERPAVVLETGKPVRPTRASELAEPRLVLAGGKMIAVEVGHAAPLVVDFDGDGVRDLLVGQFGDGKLNIFKNTRTNAAPILAEGVFLQAGGKDATIPAS
jgi:hypothetical protein